MNVMSVDVKCDRGHLDPLRCSCAKRVLEQYPPKTTLVYLGGDRGYTRFRVSETA